MAIGDFLKETILDEERNQRFYSQMLPILINLPFKQHTAARLDASEKRDVYRTFTAPTEGRALTDYTSELGEWTTDYENADFKTSIDKFVTDRKTEMLKILPSLAKDYKGDFMASPAYYRGLEDLVGVAERALKERERYDGYDTRLDEIRKNLTDLSKTEDRDWHTTDGVQDIIDNAVALKEETSTSKFSALTTELDGLMSKAKDEELLSNAFAFLDADKVKSGFQPYNAKSDQDNISGRVLTPKGEQHMRAATYHWQLGDYEEALVEYKQAEFVAGSEEFSKVAEKLDSGQVGEFFDDSGTIVKSQWANNLNMIHDVVDKQMDISTSGWKGEGDVGGELHSIVSWFYNVGTSPVQGENITVDAMDYTLSEMSGKMIDFYNYGASGQSMSFNQKVYSPTSTQSKIIGAKQIMNDLGVYNYRREQKEDGTWVQLDGPVTPMSEGWSADDMAEHEINMDKIIRNLDYNRDNPFRKSNISDDISPEARVLGQMMKAIGITLEARNKLMSIDKAKNDALTAHSYGKSFTEGGLSQFAGSASDSFDRGRVDEILNNMGAFTVKSGGVDVDSVVKKGNKEITPPESKRSGNMDRKLRSHALKQLREVWNKEDKKAFRSKKIQGDDNPSYMVIADEYLDLLEPEWREYYEKHIK